MSTGISPLEALDVAHEISKILDCGLEKESLSLCIALLETGVNPESLAVVIKKLRAKRTAAQQRQQQLQQQHF